MGSLSLFLHPNHDTVISTMNNLSEVYTATTPTITDRSNLHVQDTSIHYLVLLQE